MENPNPRHRLFLAAQRRAELSLQQLWLRYVALTGTHGIFDIDAFLNGVNDLPLAEQDILGHALNERLMEIYRSSQVPYLTLNRKLPEDGHDDPSTLFRKLLEASFPDDEPPMAT